MLERITDTYCFWQAKRWIRFKSEGALQAISDYLVYTTLGLDTSLCEHWNRYMRDADDKIYGTFREVLIELGVPTAEEIEK